MQTNPFHLQFAAYTVSQDLMGRLTGAIWFPDCRKPQETLQATETTNHNFLYKQSLSEKKNINKQGFKTRVVPSNYTFKKKVK